MITIMLTMMMFLELLMYMMMADMILSWLTLFGLKFSPQFLKNMVDPLYKMVKSIIPTTMWPMDFTPMVMFMLISFMKWAMYMLFPEVKDEMLNLLN